jgi:hypothetical protein
VEKVHIAKLPVQATMVAWGNHFREGRIVESGKVPELQAADLVEIIAEIPTRNAGKAEVRYQIGSSPEVFTISEPRTSTIGEVRILVARAHNRTGRSSLSYEGGTVDDDEPLEDWIQRTNDHPFQIGLINVLQVHLNFRGGSHPLEIRTGATKEEFSTLAKAQLGLAPKAHVRVEQLDPGDWQIRNGRTY